MSDDSDDHKDAGSHERSEKKRKIQRACDMCRRRKTKCDGPQSKNGVCSFCVSGGFKCAYVEAATKRGPPKGYLESVEKRMFRLEALVEKLAPGRDFTSELGAKISARDTFDLATHTRLEPRASSTTSPAAPNRTVLSPSSFRQSSETMDESDTDEEEATMREMLRTFSLDKRHVVQGGFLGKSSGIHLVTSIQNLRPTKSQPLSDAVAGIPEPSPPWENADERHDSQPSSAFWPQQDLVRPLIDSFFEHINPYHPVLHRPTFDSAFSSRLYETDHGFAEVCLMVFALGSQDLDDPRVRDPTEEGTSFSRGWPFFRGFLHGRKRNWGDVSGIYGIQAVTLASLFNSKAGDSKVAWVLIGVGLRACIGLGVHRKHVARAMTPALGELYKRCFWLLYITDRSSAAIFGRPVGIQDEDMDVDYPIEVDDEFWECEDPEQNFEQPEGKPSRLSAFVANIKLHEIIGTTLKSVYSITKAKTKRPQLDTLEAQQKLIQELDSELNSWVASLPNHLRWNPNDNTTLFFGQAAILHSTFYATQILVHRPFIPSATRPSRLGFPSLAICSNAARSGTHVLEIALASENGGAASSSVRIALLGQGFIFSVVLLISIWGAKGGVLGDQAKAAKDLTMIIDLIGAQEERWLFCRRLKHVLLLLASQSPVESIVASSKRVREEEPVATKPSIPGRSAFDSNRPTTGRTSDIKPAFTTGTSSSLSFGTDDQPSLASTSTSMPPSSFSTDPNIHYSPSTTFGTSTQSPASPLAFTFNSIPSNTFDPPTNSNAHPSSSSQPSTFHFHPQQPDFNLPNFQQPTSFSTFPTFRPPPPQQADELLGQRLAEGSWGFDTSFFGSQLATEDQMGGANGGGMMDFESGGGLNASSTVPWSGFETNDWTSYLASFSMPPQDAEGFSSPP